VKDSLIRFGVAMESSLVEQLDAMAAARGCNRSELLRDLTRAEASRVSLTERVPAFAAVTLVYNHHVRELSERLTSLQHAAGDQVRSTMHVHLDHDHCMEVIVMRGRSDQLKATTERMLGTRGVIAGGAEYVAEQMLALTGATNHGRSAAADDDHEALRKVTRSGPHAHDHAGEHEHEHEPAAPVRPTREVRRRTTTTSITSRKVATAPGAAPPRKVSRRGKAG
jgi:CopG family nickel-responsive transcriptional regulator